MLTGGGFLKLVPDHRTLWLRGRRGSGKTALAVRLAYWLLDQGMVDRIWSNIPIAGAENPTPETARNVAIVFDESWLMLDSRDFAKNEVKAWGAFLRKWNIYLLLPSVFAVDVRFRAMYVESVLHLGSWFWAYKYVVDLGYTREQGFLFWSSPSEVFGTFDSYYSPTCDGGILWAIKESIAREKASNDERAAAVRGIQSGGTSDAADGAWKTADVFPAPLEQYHVSPDGVAGYPL